MKSAMGGVKRGNAPVLHNDRSALEYMYMKPWRKSFLTREFLSNPVFEIDSDQDTSHYPASHSVFTPRQGSSQPGQSFPERCPSGAFANNKEARSESGEDNEE
jgi:hypothetical protein